MQPPAGLCQYCILIKHPVLLRRCLWEGHEIWDLGIQNRSNALLFTTVIKLQGIITRVFLKKFKICVTDMSKYLVKKLISSTTQNWVTPNTSCGIIHELFNDNAPAAAVKEEQKQGQVSTFNRATNHYSCYILPRHSHERSERNFEECLLVRLVAQGWLQRYVVKLVWSIGRSKSEVNIWIQYFILSTAVFGYSASGTRI